MRIAFISDIHGNASALEKVLADIRSKSVDQIVVLGDLVFRGPEPELSLSLIRALNTLVVKGNTDEWVVRGIRADEVPQNDWDIMVKEREWCVRQLSEESLKYLNCLPMQCWVALSEELTIHAFHATPTDLFEVHPPDSPTERLQRKLMTDVKSSIYVYAHTHHPVVRFIDGKCVVNPGAIGYTFDGYNQSSYAIIESGKNRFRVTIERVPYDVEQVVRSYYTSGYPNADLMSIVLRKGIHPVLAGPYVGKEKEAMFDV